MTMKYEYLKDYYKFTNWRLVSNNRYNSGGYGIFNYIPRIIYKKGIWVLMDNYVTSCFIYGMIAEEFLQISKSGDYRSFVDHLWDHQGNISHCPICNGAGKFDWISRITGPRSFDKTKRSYVRDKSKIITFKNANFLKHYIFAPTKVFKGERICKGCMGTGIYINITDVKELISCNINNINMEDI